MVNYRLIPTVQYPYPWTVSSEAALAQEDAAGIAPKIETIMKHFINGRSAFALIGLSFAPLPVGLTPAAMAVSPAQEYCEDVLGGYFEKTGGQITCTVYSAEYTGNDHGQLVESIVYVYTNGTWNNDPQAGGGSSCDGPGGSGNKSAHCK